MVFVAAIVLALVVRLITQRHGAEQRTDIVAERTGGIWTWTVRGHPVVPATTEGRFAVAAARARRSGAPSCASSRRRSGAIRDATQEGGGR